MKNKKGFTLIEMLGVVALIAILFLLSYTTILNYLKSSQDKIDEGTYQLLKNATKDYITDNKDDYPEVNKNVFCIDVNALIDNNYIDEDQVVSQNKKLLTKTMKVSYTDNNYNYELVDSSTCKEFVKTTDSAVKYLLSKTNDKAITTYESESDASHQMYTFEHPATEQTSALTDYRYIGNDPYNYVDFNGETWRIIGVFNVENEQGQSAKRIKIIANQSWGSGKWNDTNLNDWNDSKLNKSLNGYYYDSELINNNAKQMIEATKFYLGGTFSIYNSVEDDWGDNMYSYERGNKTSTSTAKSSWVGNIGLIYPSDYIYTYPNSLDDSCYKSYCHTQPSSWLYDVLTGYVWTDTTGSHFSHTSSWTITPNSLSYASGDVFVVSSPGYVSNGQTYLHNMVTSNNYLFVPVVYLKSNVKIINGDGTKDNPYKLEI